MLRTCTCGELRADDLDREVTLCGWVDSYRDHGGGLFVDLRDRYGITQVVFNPPQTPDDVIEASKALRDEFVIRVTGTVAHRPEGQTNPRLATGEIEVRAVSFELLNKSLTPPLEISARRPEGLLSFKEWWRQRDAAQAEGDTGPAPTFREWLKAQEEGVAVTEERRLRYRFLDLRRERMQNILMLRHRITKVMRDYFDENRFIDVETPILGRSTPEGARDYLVPSRVHRGSFYALPQSPQLYKQIMMIAGYDRYVQIARCFRDEDLRADRQPEFTQLDMEMAFVKADDVMAMIEGLMARLFKEVLNKELKLPLARMTYDEAMRRFGHDAPDLRYGMELVEVSDLAAQSGFRVFAATVESGGHVRGLNAKGAADNYSRKGIDELTEYVQQDFGAKGLAWFKVDAEGKLASPIAKNFADGVLEKIGEKLDAEPGDLLLFIADRWEVTCKTLAGLRRRLAVELKLFDPSEVHCSWVVDFPMFERDEASGQWVAMHHPFTMPLDEDLAKLESEPEKVRAQAYDLIVNGFEAGGGTIRIHDNAIQQQVFRLMGMTEESARERFGFLLEALEYGAPPHGGIALGLDRLVMIFGGLDNIRDCMAFPKTQRATDLMTGAPGKVGPGQIRELGLKLER